MNTIEKPTVASPNTLELILRAEGETLQERLIAELDDFGFERFWQEDRRLRAYVPEDTWEEAQRAGLEAHLRSLGVEGPIVLKSLENTNWNAVWEKGLVPITAGPFVVKPTWADAPAEHDARYVIEIDPKMSFGTGHHESTRLVLRLMSAHADEHDVGRVLDAGTGTAVLAVAAVRLGATSVLAFDIDARVLENATENIEHNDVADQVELRAGWLMDVIPESGFDLILANINRNALSEMLGTLEEKLNPGGRVILAGLLLSDRAPMLRHAADCGMELEAEEQENEWWSACLVRSEA